MTKPHFDQIRYDLAIPQGADSVAHLVPPGSPVHEVLFRVGVPRDFLVGTIHIDPKVSIVNLPTSPPLIRFATYGGHYPVVVETETGHVYQIDTFMQENHPELCFMNTTLAQFNETIREIISLYPFDYEDSNGVEHSSRDEIEPRILAIDEHAFDQEAGGPEPFWSLFLGDVDMALYSVEEILDPDQ